MSSILYPGAISVALLCMLHVPADRTGADAAHSADVSIAMIDSHPSPVALAPDCGGLTIQCPDLAKLFCGDSIDPSVTGEPTVTGACDDHPVITYHDTYTFTNCPADRFDSIIIRTWTATDSCGNSDSCDQKIDVLKDILFFDMHPTSCPNPVNVTGNGVIPAALLGTASFDVHDIDWTTVQLWGQGCNGGPVSPTHHAYEDVSTPYTGDQVCGCNTLHGDGYTDLTLKFDKQQVVNSLHLASYPHFSDVRVVIVGKLTNGCGFFASDCVRVQ